jgi:hypothetical protein
MRRSTPSCLPLLSAQRSSCPLLGIEMGVRPARRRRMEGGFGVWGSGSHALIRTSPRPGVLLSRSGLFMYGAGADWGVILGRPPCLTQQTSTRRNPRAAKFIRPFAGLAARDDDASPSGRGYTARTEVVQRKRELSLISESRNSLGGCPASSVTCSTIGPWRYSSMALGTGVGTRLPCAHGAYSLDWRT